MTFLSTGVRPYFRRLRISSRGVLLEDISDWTRVSEMFSLFQSEHVTANNAIESSVRWDRGNTTTKHKLETLKKKVLNGKILSGILSQNKFLPLPFMNSLDLELELVGNAGDAVHSGVVNGEAWTLSDISLKADIVSIDNELMNTYTKHLQEGNEIRLRYSTYHSQQNAVPGNNFSVNITRGLLTLQSCFVFLNGTFYGETGNYQI